MKENREQLIKLVHTRMPFGKYKGWLLIDIPEPYYVWYSSKGFPSGKFGEQLQLMHTIKVNGLEGLIRPLIQIEK